MARDVSFECEKTLFFLTIRTMSSKLWFVNNQKLHERIVAFLARFQEMYGVELFAFIIMGNHYHLLARFPRRNKRLFCQALNSMIARLTATHVEEFEGGKLWARPVRAQALGDHKDALHWFFYIALNPVGAGLCRKISEYNGYNSFRDALTGRKRRFRIFLRELYYNRKRRNPSITEEACTVEHTLRFSRLPGYESLDRKDYERMLLSELEARRQKIISDRLAAGKGFATPSSLRECTPGMSPHSTKTSTRTSKRPLILTLCEELKREFLGWYFDLRARYREASRRFREGDLLVTFPPNTYRPTTFSTVPS